MKTDIKLRDDVLAELDWDPAIDQHEVGVLVRDGVVTLTGSVENLAEKWAAGRAALRIGGVRTVANQIEVKSRDAGGLSDTEIAHEVAKSLEWHAQVPHNRIKATVAQGAVTLQGSVDWRYQREAAEEVARKLNGVRSITNLIIVSPPLSPSEIKEKIERAFRRTAGINEGVIAVHVDNDVVSLHGNVDSWAHAEEAERIAWSAPGVREVRNNLALWDLDKRKIEGSA